MSKQLLLALNGSRKGALHHWLSKFNGEPRIAWYPSAGVDFRDVLYLNKRFCEHSPAKATEPSPPDFFFIQIIFLGQQAPFLTADSFISTTEHASQ